MNAEAAGSNRSKLLSCALSLFAARGYDAVGVQEIVEAAGVTKPTLYHYFGSKLGLLNALLVEHLEPMLADIERAAAYRHDLPLTLTQIARTYFAFARTHPDVCRMYISLWFAPLDSEAYKAVIAFHERQHALLEKLFREAAQDHGNMKNRQRTYAAAFQGMLNNHVGLALNGYTTLSEPVLHTAVRHYMHGIFS